MNRDDSYNCHWNQNCECNEDNLECLDYIVITPIIHE